MKISRKSTNSIPPAGILAGCRSCGDSPAARYAVKPNSLHYPRALSLHGRSGFGAAVCRAKLTSRFYTFSKNACQGAPSKRFVTNQDSFPGHIQNAFRAPLSGPILSGRAIRTAVLTLGGMRPHNSNHQTYPGLAAHHHPLSRALPGASGRVFASASSINQSFPTVRRITS